MDSSNAGGAIIMQPLTIHGKLDVNSGGGVFENNGIFKCSRDPPDHFCSAVSYDIRNEDDLTIMRGTQQLGGYCCAGVELPAIIFLDSFTLENAVEFKLSAPTIYEGQWNVVVVDGQGNSIGKISKAGFEETSHFQMELFHTNDIFTCDEVEEGESTAIYLIKNENSGAQIATIEADVAFKTEFKLIINKDSDVDPHQKALCLGVVILEDTIHQQNS